VLRKINGFAQDAAGEWIADLDCGHRRHVRHDPPLSERPWVESAGGRAERLGAEIECGRCARREIPDGHAAYRRTPTFDEGSVPSALTRAHTTKKGVWALIHVLEGRLEYRMHAPFDTCEILEPGAPASVVPEVEHAVAPIGAVRFFVEFLKRSNSTNVPADAQR
jgi:tellurite methyltransferase